MMSTNSNKIVTEADNNSTVVLEKNQKLVVQLGANYTTGAQWLVCPTLNPNFTMEGPTFMNTEERIGGTTTAVFTFTLTKPEPTRICLENKRSWEKEVYKTFTVNLTVK